MPKSQPKEVSSVSTTICILVITQGITCSGVRTNILEQCLSHEWLWKLLYPLKPFIICLSHEVLASLCSWASQSTVGGTSREKSPQGSRQAQALPSIFAQVRAPLYSSAPSSIGHGFSQETGCSVKRFKEIIRSFGHRVQIQNHKKELLKFKSFPSEPSLLTFPSSSTCCPYSRVWKHNGFLGVLRN